MVYGIVLVLHIIGAVGALVTGFLALNIPNGTPRHRLIGKAYLVLWLLVFINGGIIGYWHRHLTVFQLLNTLGMSMVALAYGTIIFRKRIGSTWLHKHYTYMVTSMAFLVVATVNQVLPRLGWNYPLWVFLLMVASPAFVLPLYVRRLDRRYGRLKQQRGVRAAART
jgi:hypothetical protein